MANRDTVVFLRGDVAAVETLTANGLRTESADGGETRKHGVSTVFLAKDAFRERLKESVKEKCKQRRRQRGAA